MDPVLRLLNAKPTTGWSAKQQGALRSAFTGRQWCQCRLRRAGRATSRNCCLCVAFGLCDPEDPHPRWTGHEVHRLYTCPVMEPHRVAHAPRWLLEEVQAKIDVDSYTICAKDVGFYTQALAMHPRPRLRAKTPRPHLHWVVPPPEGVLTGDVYVDGSRLFAEHDLGNMCVRLGFAIAAFDSHGNNTALAQGVPPPWIEGIYGAELYSLTEAAAISDLGARFTTDCMGVCNGTKRGFVWANAPSRRYAQAWGPLIASLDADGDRVRWMPAHQSAQVSLKAELARQKRTLSDGSTLTIGHVRANALVDKHAKLAAGQFKPPACDFELIRRESSRLRDVAVWIGLATEVANHWPAPRDPSDTGPIKHIRDSSGSRPLRKLPRKTSEGLALPASSLCSVLPAGGKLLHEGTDPGGEGRADAGCAASPPETGGVLKRPRAGPTTSAAVLVDRSAKRARVHASALESADSLRLQDWLEARPASRPPPVSAQQRLLQLRTRLSTKECAAGLEPPPCADEVSIAQPLATRASADGLE